MRPAWRLLLHFLLCSTLSWMFADNTLEYITAFLPRFSVVSFQVLTDVTRDYQQFAASTTKVDILTPELPFGKGFKWRELRRVLYLREECIFTVTDFSVRRPEFLRLQTEPRCKSFDTLDFSSFSQPFTLKQARAGNILTPRFSLSVTKRSRRKPS